jgi:hypothetical protein
MNLIFFYRNSMNRRFTTLTRWSVIMQIKLTQFLALILVSLFLNMSPAQYTTMPQDDSSQEVISRGMGLILSGDEAKAEDDAIAGALRNAVEQVIGTMI